MTVDTRTLVIPPLIERGIHANSYNILAAIFDIICDVEAERRVPAEVSPKIEAVEEDDRIPEHTIEVERDAPPFIRRRYVESSLIPTDTRRRKLSPQPLSAVCGVDRNLGFLNLDKRQFDRPIVRKVHYAPCTVVKTMLQRSIGFIVQPILPGFGIGALASWCAPAKILRRIVRISKMETPAKIQQ